MSQSGDHDRASRLRVLPSSGKAEQLRREIAADAPRPAAEPSAASAPSGTPSGTPSDESPAALELRERVVETLKTVYDPELPVNIYDLGLIYHIAVDPAAGAVRVRMTLTAPGCPVAGTLPGEIRHKIAAVDGVTSAEVELVWDPPWTKDRMSEEALLMLGF